MTVTGLGDDDILAMAPKSKVAVVFQVSLVNLSSNTPNGTKVWKQVR